MRRGVGIACMWYGCGNTSLPNPSTMRIALVARRPAHLLQRRGRYRPGLDDRAPADRRRCARPAAAKNSSWWSATPTSPPTPARPPPRARPSSPATPRGSPRSTLRRKILALANAGEDAALSLDGAWLTIGDGEASRQRRSRDARGRRRRHRARRRRAAGTRRPRRSTRTARASPTPPTASPRRSRRSRSTCALGTVKVLAIVAAHDVGRAINPTLIEGQIHGGIAQGLGLALMEEFIPGRTENLHDYLIPTVGDMPQIKIYLIEDPEPEGPFGAKGVGEPALIATAPAILGAIRHATGARITRVPVLPHRVWEALRQWRPRMTRRSPLARSALEEIRRGGRRRHRALRRLPGALPHPARPRRRLLALRQRGRPARPRRSGRAAAARRSTRAAGWWSSPAANGTESCSIRRAPSSPASAPAPPIPTTSPRRSSSPPSMRASTPSPS